MNIEEKLNTEIEWLNKVNLQEEENCEEMQMLLAGHLKLVATLFTCDGIDKESYGQLYSIFIASVLCSLFLCNYRTRFMLQPNPQVPVSSLHHDHQLSRGATVY